MDEMKRKYSVYYALRMLGEFMTTYSERFEAKGVPEGAKARAKVLDYTHNLVEADFSFENGRLTLRKNDEYSAVFLVEWVRE